MSPSAEPVLRSPRARLRILFAGHTSVRSFYRVGSHHLVAAWGRMGHSAVHVAPAPHKLRYPRGLRESSVHTLGAWFEVEEFLPRMIPPAGALGSSISPRLQRLARRSVSAQMRRQGLMNERWDVVFIDKVTFRPHLENVEADVRVFRPSDIHDYADSSPLLEAERRLWTESDIVISTSDAILQYLEQRHGKTLAPCAAFRNGVGCVPLADNISEAVRRPRAAYIGAYDDRFDFDFISVLAGRDAIDIDLYGPMSRAARRRLPNSGRVTVHGALPPHRVCETLAQSSVGLLPFAKVEANRGRAPMKLYEYLGNGLPVIATGHCDLDPTLIESGLVRRGRTREEAADFVVQALSVTPAHRLMAHSVAIPHRWDAIAARYLEVLT